MIPIEEALEGSTPLAQKVRAMGPAATRSELVAQMREAIPMLSEEEKVATLNAHPRIGDDPAKLSKLSLAEQGSDILPELTRLNAEYERRFGFRFVFFVNKRPKTEIVQVLKQRLTASRQEEMSAGLRAIVDIAEDRLRK
ncbi:MAG: 2-oxo-4-hydroxy-4-carboxy-5-ureidoimidazoline decarboxylase [Candidatus Dormibacteraeota bacterium]|nr:2-oxo-4-hydroxy-4-carboxy-5-ureidoimidazoline decarboxylase [Candidatus Dormibacteraeota bacterium]